MCGFDVQEKSLSEVRERIYTEGCLKSIRMWVESNLYWVGGIALGVAFVQLLGEQELSHQYDGYAGRSIWSDYRVLFRDGRTGSWNRLQGSELGTSPKIGTLVLHIWIHGSTAIRLWAAFIR